MPETASVFVSSTSEDLKPYRDAVRDAVIGAQMLPTMMEYFVASGEKPPLHACLANVSEAHLLVVIVAQRYGWVPPDQAADQHKSITWLECEQAVADGKEVLAFLLDEKQPWPEDAREAYRLTAAMQNGGATEDLFREVNRNVNQLKDFKAWLNSRRIRATFTTPEDLRRCVSDALHDWRRRHPDSESVTPTTPTALAVDATVPPTVPPPYVEWLVSRCGELELMGLQSKRGGGVRLNQVYTPLATSARVDEDSQGRRKQDVAPPRESRETVQLLLELLDKESLYVSGDPGSGKSTFCRWVAWLACQGQMPTVDVPAPDGYQETFPDSLRGRLPVLVRLRDFWPHLTPAPGVRSLTARGIEAALEQWLRDQKAPSLDGKCLAAHLARGSALILLDGVDEVPPLLRVDSGEWYPRERLLEGLAEAIQRWTQAGNRVLVTSRPYGLDQQQQARLRLWDAPLQELDQPLQGLLVRRWFVRLNENRDQALNTAEAMIGHLHRERSLDELAANPLLLTAMCIIYDEGKRLPHDKYLLYDRVVDTVLHKRYPPAKEKVNVIRGRLAAVALGMHTGEGLGQQRPNPEPVASAGEIDLLLQAYQQLDGSTDKGLGDTVYVREDLLSQSGLLVGRDDNRASFYHLSFQEFLAAERLFVLLGRQSHGFADLLLERGPAAGWRNTLSFVFGSVISKFNAHVGVELLQQVVQRMELPPLDAAQRGRTGGVWNLGIVLGDCLEILLGREAAVPEDLSGFFDRLVRQAIAQEISAKERHSLAVAWSWLGDSRITTDLRVSGPLEEHPGFVRISAGSYCYGDDKQPLLIDQPFWLSRYPVTNSQYALFLEQGGYTREEWWSGEGWQWIKDGQLTEPALWRNHAFNARNQPVVGVSWWEAEAFCRWAGGRLPSEREWEAAARGLQGRTYPWGDKWEDGICNSLEAGLGGTSAVGIFPRDVTSEGICDMGGNVWEWCQDHWEATYRVLRGGCWWRDARDCRAADRGWYGPQFRDDYLGFRVAAVPPGGQTGPAGGR